MLHILSEKEHARDQILHFYLFIIIIEVCVYFGIFHAALTQTHIITLCWKLQCEY